MKKSFLLVFLCGLLQIATAQEFNFEEVVGPPNHTYSFNVANLGGVQYLSYFDASFNQVLFGYDGTDFTPIGGPVGLTYSFFLGQNGGNLYMAYYDNFFNQALVGFDGTDFVVMDPPTPNQAVNSFQFELNGFPFFDFFDFFTFNQFLKYYDGDEMVDVDLPDNHTFGFTVGVLDNFAYVILFDPFFFPVLYRFDGVSFVQVPLPANTSFPFQLAATEDVLYLGLNDDLTFQQVLFEFDGANFTEILSPLGYQVGGYVGELQDELYFFYYDPFFNPTLFRLNGTTLEEYPGPPGFTYSWNTGSTETEFYLSYYDGSFIQWLFLFDGNDFTQVPNPPNGNFNTFEVEYEEDGPILTFYDQNFNLGLFFFDGTETLEIPDPEVNYTFGDYQFQLGDGYYFFYYDEFFNVKLYRLTGEPNLLPSAADNSVTTLKNTPYKFKIEDFNFVDLNADDTLAAIEILEIPAEVGIMHLNGANLNNGDVILAENIKDLTYVPYSDGLGQPYDSFLFRVSDGEDFSEDIYTMLINVVETLSTQDPALAQAIQVYPNPVQDRFQLEMDAYSAEKGLDLMLYNQLGQVVRYENWGLQLQGTIDVADLPAGYYQLLVRDGNRFASKAIIIQ